MFCAPSLTSATSRRWSTEPSGLARMTMLPNSSGVTNRPRVCRLIWNGCASSIGRAPRRPAGAMMFCSLIAATTSVGERPSATNRSVRNQIRIE
jgi:hypothetical protein